MSNHNKHVSHIDHATEKNDQKNTSDIDIISNMLDKLKPEDLSALLSNYNLGSSKAINQNKVFQDVTPIVNPNQIRIQNNSNSNKILELLIAIKPLLSFERGQTLNKMIQLYAVGNILKR